MRDNNLIDTFWNEVLGFCGCGNPEHFTFKIYQYLAHRYNDFRDHGEEKIDLIPLDIREIGAWEFMDMVSYVADKAGLTEHGGAVCAAWLSDLGKEWLFKLHNYFSQDKFNKKE